MNNDRTKGEKHGNRAGAKLPLASYEGAHVHEVVMNNPMIHSSGISLGIFARPQPKYSWLQSSIFSQPGPLLPLVPGLTFSR